MRLLSSLGTRQRALLADQPSTVNWKRLGMAPPLGHDAPIQPFGGDSLNCPRQVRVPACVRIAVQEFNRDWPPADPSNAWINPQTGTPWPRPGPHIELNYPLVCGNTSAYMFSRNLAAVSRRPRTSEQVAEGIRPFLMEHLRAGCEGEPDLRGLDPMDYLQRGDLWRRMERTDTFCWDVFGERSSLTQFAVGTPDFYYDEGCVAPVARLRFDPNEALVQIWQPEPRPRFPIGPCFPLLTTRRQERLTPEQHGCFLTAFNQANAVHPPIEYIRLTPGAPDTSLEDRDEAWMAYFMGFYRLMEEHPNFAFCRGVSDELLLAMGESTFAPYPVTYIHYAHSGAVFYAPGSAYAFGQHFPPPGHEFDFIRCVDPGTA